MENLALLSKDNLQAELEKAEASLEDLREERAFTLGQTGVHLGASRVEYLKSSWGKEERQILEKIQLINSRLTEMG